jgi:hypothetical protein
MILLFIGLTQALQVDITVKQAWQKVVGTCTLGFLKLKLALAKAFGPILRPVCCLVRAYGRNVCEVFVFVVDSIGDGLHVTHIAVVQGVKKGRTGLSR